MTSMFVVDTNILVYAANEDAPEHERCPGCSRSGLTVPNPDSSPGARSTFLRVVTHPRVFPVPFSALDALSFIDALLSSASVAPWSRPSSISVLREVLETVPGAAGLVLFNVRTAVIMREHGIRRIVARDRDFVRFPFIEAIDPLA